MFAIDFKMWRQLLILSTTFLISNCYVSYPGPNVYATEGKVWPKPQNINKSDEYLQINPYTFSITTLGSSCPKLENAMERYSIIIFNSFPIDQSLYCTTQPSYNDSLFRGELENLIVVMNNCEEQIPENMDESYTLTVSENGTAILTANQFWGALRGLETFTQSVYMTKDVCAFINIVNIYDYPRFSHRGLLIDTARHYLSPNMITQIMESMLYNKMNVLHWHIVDDQSFPYYYSTFPNLTYGGAYAESKIYTKNEIENIIKMGNSIGIRVIPEFTTPGHTSSWYSVPNLLTECYKTNGIGLTPIPDGTLGPINPILEENYEFMDSFFKDVEDTFIDSFVHLGGDEVSHSCWLSNPDIIDYMTSNNITDPADLEVLYMTQVINYISSLNRKSIVWEEVFMNGVIIPSDSMVQVWKTQNSLKLVVQAKVKALLSSCWYLDNLDKSWEDFYNCEPFANLDTDEEKSYVIGGEACMWGENVDASNIMSTVWPRASATAERLWSNEEVLDVGEATARIEEHACRLRNRYVDAAPPNGPGFCITFNKPKLN